MSSASLAVVQHAHPDAARIAAISAAIALNLAVLMIASRPITPAQLAVVRQLAPVPLIHLIDPPALLPPPPPIELKPLPPRTLSPARLRPHPASVPVIVPVTEGQLAATPSAPTLLPVSAEPGPTVPAAPVEASLAYLSAPLRFPIQALRQGMHGTVLLQVLVDETGRPTQVTVERSSGYTLLDRSAREQVLAGWRFQPAMVHGQAVRAWAHVPVAFDLHPQ
jgi:protein TonB